MGTIQFVQSFLNGWTLTAVMYADRSYLLPISFLNWKKMSSISFSAVSWGTPGPSTVIFYMRYKNSEVFPNHLLKTFSLSKGHLAVGKWRIIALTNNFSSKDSIPQSELEHLGWQDGPTPRHVRDLFDDFCGSSELGLRCVACIFVWAWHDRTPLRKPEAEFYLVACKRNDIRPQEAVFLDDIGTWACHLSKSINLSDNVSIRNLKAARKLGMQTIRESFFATMSMFDVCSDSYSCVDVPIGGTINAVKALEEYIGIDLSSGLEVKL
jgi:hypothetical protein